MKPAEQQSALPTEFDFIVTEVNKHGFYTLKLDTFIVEASNRDEIIDGIHLTAKQANLKVSFNPVLGECVFELM